MKKSYIAIAFVIAFAISFFFIAGLSYLAFWGLGFSEKWNWGFAVTIWAVFFILKNLFQKS